MECSNGMIHVIDKVILKERDITLAFSNSPGSIVNSIFVTMLAAILVNVVNVQWKNNKQKENKRMIGDCQIVEVIYLIGLDHWIRIHLSSYFFFNLSRFFYFLGIPEVSRDRKYVSPKWHILLHPLFETHVFQSPWAVFH